MRADIMNADANQTAQSLSVDQLAAMPDEQRVALLRAQDTAELTPLVLGLVQAKAAPSAAVVLGDVMFIMQERFGDPKPYFEWCATLGLNN
jgi:hypothetical protein